MFVTIVGNGSGEGCYDNQCIRIADEVGINEVQKLFDEKKEELFAGSLDQYGDVDTSKISLGDIVGVMPAEWKAEILQDKCEMVFL